MQSTNYYDEVPDTGVTVEVSSTPLLCWDQIPDFRLFSSQVYLELVNTTASLDGVERNVLLVNGTFPGPTIIADWGDTVVVHLTNSLAYVSIFGCSMK